MSDLALCNGVADGHLSCLQYAAAAGRKFTGMNATLAITNGHKECLRYMLGSGCKLDAHVLVVAAGEGDIEMLAMLDEVGCPRDTNAGCAAAYNGHLEALRWMHANHHKFSDYVCYSAVRGKHLDVLKWLHETAGYPLTNEAINAACGVGNLECLKYLHEKNCPHSSQVYARVIESGDKDCLRYLLRNNFGPYEIDECFAAAEFSGHREMLELLP